MKSKLPCCDINKKATNYTWECGYCECAFKKKKMLDDHNHEIHSLQLASKRKLNCCEHNGKKRQKLDQHPCHYCECVFRNKFERDSHVDRVHKCSNCADIILNDEIRTIHDAQHKQEDQLERLQEQRQRQMDDDFVLCYVNANKLDEYQPSSDQEPDIKYILSNYEFEREELLQFVKKFKAEFIDSFDSENFEECPFEPADLAYLAENGALTNEDLAYFQDCFVGYEDDGSMLLYLLDRDYQIKPEWVANVIDNDELVERVKQKHTFTFREIYETAEPDDEDEHNRFYVQVHRHFPNPNFKDPFADPYEDFKTVKTEHVKDHLNSRYFYNSEEDKLSIVVGGDENEREIPLGGCAEMCKRSLEVLVKEYEVAARIYDKLNERVSDLFDKREAELDEAYNQDKREEIFDYYHDEIWGEALPIRNEQANIVSKLYFVISLKH